MVDTKPYFPVLLSGFHSRTLAFVWDAWSSNYKSSGTRVFFSVVLFYFAVQGGSNFWVYGWNPKVWSFKWKLLSSTFLWYCLLCCTRWFEPSKSVDEILIFEHSNENFWTVLSCVQELLLCFTRSFQSLEFLITSNVIIHMKCSLSSLIWFRFPFVDCKI